MSDKTLTATFGKWRNRFLRQAMSMLPSEEDAEDVLQDAFEKLWPRAESLETENDVVALASVTIRNMSIDLYRKNKRFVNVDLEDNEIDEIDDNSSDMAGERLKLVNKFMSLVLTEKQREIIRLRDLESMSFDDIGKAMGMQPTAVRVQLSRARKAIREAYRKQNKKY